MNIKLYIFLFFSFLLFNAGSHCFAQCVTPTKRVYASRQAYNRQLAAGIVPLGSVDNADRAVNGDIKDFSTLNLLALSNVVQFLEFREGSTPKSISANTPVTVKIAIPDQLLSAVSNVSIRPFTSLTGSSPSATATYNPNDDWQSVSSSLINVASGRAIIEVTYIPQNIYNGIAIRLSGAILSSIDVFDAYITETDTSPSLDCNLPIDVLSGVKAGTAVGGIASATGSVSNPYNIIDGNDNTYSEMNIGAQVLSEVYEMVIFNTPSQPGDEVKIILQNSSGGVLDLDLLTGFTIQAYNGTTPVGPPISSNSTGLSLSLLSGGGGDEKYQLTTSIDGIYDRVEIKMGNLAGIQFTALKIYEVSRSMPVPTAIINNDTSFTAICAGNNVTLNIENPLSCTQYFWYDVPSNGTALASGTTYTTPNLTTGKTYYVEAKHENACNEVSARIPVNVAVNPLPSADLGTMPEICIENSYALLQASNYQNGANTYQIEWGTSATNAGFINVSTDTTLPSNGEIQIAVPVGATPDTYSGSITVKNANGCESLPQNFNVTIKAAPTAPPIVINSTASY